MARKVEVAEAQSVCSECRMLVVASSFVALFEFALRNNIVVVALFFPVWNLCSHDPSIFLFQKFRSCLVDSDCSQFGDWITILVS